MAEKPFPVYFTKTAAERLLWYAPHDRARVRYVAITNARAHAALGAPLEIGVRDVTAAYAELQKRDAAAESEEARETFTLTYEAILALCAASAHHSWSREETLAVLQQATLTARGHGHIAVAAADVQEAQQHAP